MRPIKAVSEHIQSHFTSRIFFCQDFFRTYWQNFGRLIQKSFGQIFQTKNLNSKLKKNSSLDWYFTKKEVPFSFVDFSNFFSQIKMILFFQKTFFWKVKKSKFGDLKIYDYLSENMGFLFIFSNYFIFEKISSRLICWLEKIFFALFFSQENHFVSKRSFL